MKRAMTIGAFGLAGALGLAGTAAAGELIREIVPAEVRWLAHVDLEALQRSVLFQTLRAEAGAALEESLEEARQELGFDPLALIRSATAFSTSKEPSTGVVALVVGEEVQGLLDKLKEQPGYRMESEGELELHALGQNGETMYAWVRTFAGVSNRLVYLSNQKAEIARAADVLEGRRPGLTDLSEPPLAARPRAGSFLYLETSEVIPGLEGVHQISAVAGLARGLRLELGETAGELFAHLAVRAKDAQDAQSITSVLQGATTLLTVLAADQLDDELRNVLASLRFTSADSEMSARFHFDSRRLIEEFARMNRGE